MFREVSRHKQALTREQCTSVLQKALRGVLAVNGEDGYPYALPINFYYDDKSATVYFHSGKVGYKVECLERADKACFTASSDGERHSGEWWLTIQSVIAFGKVRQITDKATIEEVSRRLSFKFTQDASYIDAEIEKYLPATLLLAFEIEYITGKVVKEK